ncbi:MAG: ribosome maturation factor RimM [Marinifilaceae bacterium]
MLQEKDWLRVGKIAKTHGLGGTVVINTENDLLEKYSDEPLFLLLEGAPVPFFIEEDGISQRNHTSYLVKLEFIDSKDEADRIVGLEVLMDLTTLEDEDDEDLVDYDATVLIGFTAIDQNTGTEGKVLDVVDYSGNIVVTIDIYSKEILIPLSEVYMVGVDAEKHELYLNIPQALIELN